MSTVYSPRTGACGSSRPAAAEDRFDGVVVAAGVRSRGIAAALGDRVNIYPVKGYSITVALDDPDSQAAAPWISLLDDRAKIVASRLGPDRFRIAGTAEFNGANRDIRADRIRPLVDWCERHFPAISTEHATPWAGLRPMTPSMLPRVGRGRKRRRLLQHRSRPPRLDTFRSDRPHCRGERFRRAEASSWRQGEYGAVAAWRSCRWRSRFAPLIDRLPGEPASVCAGFPGSVGCRDRERSRNSSPLGHRRTF